MKLWIALTAALFASACSAPDYDNDPIYQALLANAPTEIPAQAMPNLRRGLNYCEVYNRGEREQYATCWFAFGTPNTEYARLSYFRPNPNLNRSIRQNGGEFLPFTPGGETVSEWITL